MRQENRFQTKLVKSESAIIIRLFTGLHMKKQIIQIIYEDDDILVANKPTNVSTTTERSGKADLVDFLRQQTGNEYKEMRAVNRLEKPLSGAVILAKHTEAESKFGSLLGRKLMKRTFLAICSGFPPGDSGSVDEDIRRSHKDKNLMEVAKKKKKPALTEWTLLADYVQSCLIAAVPVTNRTQQLRVHLQATGLPPVIDPDYGGDRPIYLSDYKTRYNLGKYATEKPLIDRITLHLYQIELLEGPEGKPGCFVAPLDKDFKTAVKMLTKHNPNGTDAFRRIEVFEDIVSDRPIQY